MQAPSDGLLAVGDCVTIIALNKNCSKCILIHCHFKGYLKVRCKFNFQRKHCVLLKTGEIELPLLERVQFCFHVM